MHGFGSISSRLSVSQWQQAAEVYPQSLLSQSCKGRRRGEGVLRNAASVLQSSTDLCVERVAMASAVEPQWRTGGAS